jgi:hypothetical protein
MLDRDGDRDGLFGEAARTHDDVADLRQVSVRVGREGCATALTAEEPFLTGMATQSGVLSADSETRQATAARRA